jgi:hypothetical protein
MKGVMSGVTSTTFQPSAKITRAAFIEALYKAAGSPAVTAKTTLTDVSSSASYYKAVCWAQSVGITNGSGGKFLPSAALTREMAAAFLYRGLSALKLTAVTGGTLTGYTDSGKVSGWARTAMATLVKMGLMNGTAAKTLNPKSSLTRAETAALLYRVLGGDSQSAAPGGSSSGTSSTGSNGTAAETLNSAVTTASKTYASSAADENALRIDGAAVTLSGATVTKTGDTTSQDNSNFYGDNAGILATNGAAATITGAKITTNASGGNAVFSYGSGTTVNISDSVITTTKDNSGGIQTAGGGTTNASNLTVSTAGSSSAAIRSDRGGGTVNVTGGTYSTSGSGSPAVYSTAAISVKNATLNATNSEAIVVEGKNSVALTDCTVTGDMTGTYNDSTENIHNIMIYQSMSGDADVGTASFSASGGLDHGQSRATCSMSPTPAAPSISECGADAGKRHAAHRGRQQLQPGLGHQRQERRHRGLHGGFPDADGQHHLRQDLQPDLQADQRLRLHRRHQHHRSGRHGKRHREQRLHLEPHRRLLRHHAVQSTAPSTSTDTPYIWPTAPR